MNFKLRVAQLGDIHLGHRKTSTAHIIESLRQAFPDNDETGKLDLIVFEGDVFERQLVVEDPESDLITWWILDFLKMCERRNISVRVLEGTPVHDRHQSKEFVRVQKLARLNVDLLYVDTLAIERHPLGFTILYIPDEYRPDPEDTYKEVLLKMKEAALEQVDFIVMHGAFEYQLPPAAKSPFHSAERYLALVRHYILIGHIHHPSRFDRILAAGSLERLAHGEEESKGHNRITIDPEHGDSIEFVENKNAKTYKTIDCRGLSIEEAFDKLREVEGLRDESEIRIMANRDDAILVNVDIVRKQYPQFRWTTVAKIGDEHRSELLTDLRSRYTEIQLTSQNLPTLLEERLVKIGYAPHTVNLCMRLLKEAL